MATGMWRWCGVLALIAGVAGCGEKSEQQQLDALRGGLAYRGYRQFGDRGLPLAYEGFRRAEQLAGRTSPPLADGDLCGLHMLLSYATLSADKLTPALAESDLIERDCGVQGRQVASALRSVVFLRKQWPGLAQQQSDLAWSSAPDPGVALQQIIALHLVLAYAAANDGRWDHVIVHVDALALTFHMPWLGELGRTGLDFNEQRYVDGLRRLKRLSENPAVPVGVRTQLQDFIATVEADAGDLDSPLLMPRLLGRVLWQVVRDNATPAVSGLLCFAEQQTWVPATDSARSGWRRLLQRWRDSSKEDQPSDDSARERAAPAG